VPPVPVGGGRIGNGVRIPDRTAAVLPSEAQDAIGLNPRRPRDAMKLSQKTCLRSAYQIFGLKRDMFLSCARCGCSRRRRLRYCTDCGIYRYWPVYPAFMSVHSGKTCVFPLLGALVAERAEAGWYPVSARTWFPAADGECRPRRPQAAAPFPLGRRPGFGIAGNRGLKGFSLL